MMKDISLKILFLIFVISIMPRIVFTGVVLMVNAKDVSLLIQEDAQHYYETAVNMTSKHAEFKNNLKFGIPWDVPLYPMFLSGFFKIFNPGYLLAVFLNIVLFSLSACILYIIGVFLFGNRAALCAVVIYSFYPSLLMYSLYPMTESLFLSLFLSAFCYFILFLKNQKIRYLIPTAIFLGLSTLTKEVTIFIPLIIVFFILLKYGINWKQTVKAISLLLIIYIVVLSPLLISNYRKSGYFTLSAKTLVYTRSLQHKFNIFKKQKKAIILDKKETSSQKTDKLISNIYDYFNKRKQFFGGTGIIGMMRTLRYDVSELEATAKQPQLFLRTLKKFGGGWVIYQLSAWLFIGGVYIFSFFALLFLIARKKLKEIIYFLSILLYFLVAYFYKYATRYFIPLIPFFSLLCAYFLIVNKGANFKEGNNNYAAR